MAGLSAQKLFHVPILIDRETGKILHPLTN